MRGLICLVEAIWFAVPEHFLPVQGCPFKKVSTDFWFERKQPNTGVGNFGWTSPLLWVTAMLIRSYACNNRNHSDQTRPDNLQYEYERQNIELDLTHWKLGPGFACLLDAHQGSLIQDMNRSPRVNLFVFLIIYWDSKAWIMSTLIFFAFLMFFILRHSSILIHFSSTSCQSLTTQV